MAKFITRKQWIVAGDADGYIHVSYNTMQGLERFEAHKARSIMHLAVHPSKPYVMSTSDSETNIKLWDWEKGWECIRIFEAGFYPVDQVTFNVMDTNTFAVLFPSCF